MEATIVVDTERESDSYYMTVVAQVAEALARVNLQHCRLGRLPPLYRSGVRYRDLAGQVWRDASTIMKARPRFAQCVELAAWRTAELRCQGIAASPLIIKTGPTYFHAVVDRGFGRHEDPSRILGM